MTGKTSWTVKGIDISARDLAKQHARQKGVTIGAWLNETIHNAEKTRAENATRPEDARVDVEALSSRLELLEARLAETAGSVERSLQNVEVSVVSGFAELDRRIAAAGAAAAARPRPAEPRSAQPRTVDVKAGGGWRRSVTIGVAAILCLAIGGALALVQTRWPEQVPQLLANLTGGSMSRSDMDSGGAGATNSTMATPAPELAMEATASPDAPGLTAEAGGELAYRQAQRLLTGENGAPDAGQAEQLLESAARQGHPGARLLLAERYLEEGRGVEDNERGLFWLMKAASAAEPEAEYRLALLYAAGDKVARNYRQAVTWFHRAADHGHVDAQYNLGLLYYRGVGVKRDIQLAHEWFSVAANSGDSEAGRKRDELALLLVAGKPTGLGAGIDIAPAANAAPLSRLPQVATQDPGDEGMLRELAPLLGRAPYASGYDRALPRID